MRIDDLGADLDADFWGRFDDAHSDGRSFTLTPGELNELSWYIGELEIALSLQKHMTKLYARQVGADPEALN